MLITMLQKLKLLAPEDEQNAGAVAAVADTPAVVDAADKVQVQVRRDKVVPMAQTTLDKISRDAADKAKRAVADEWEKKARSLGYESTDAMVRAAEKAKKQPSQQQSQNRPKNKPKTQPQQAQSSTPQSGDARRLERQARESKERLDRERQQRVKAQRAAEQSKMDAWAAEANGQLARAAIKVGIKDEDYAVTLYTREMEKRQASMSEAEFDKFTREFDETKYFDGLKKTHPHLFAEIVVPATTGTVKNGDSPPPPGAGAVVQQQANGAQKSAKNMTSEEYRSELRRRGLTPPGVT